MFGGLLARIGASLIFGRIKGIFGSIPKWLWLTLAVVIALGSAVAVHQHYAHKELAVAFAAGKAESDKQWQSSFDLMKKASDQWKQNYQNEATLLADERRKTYEASLRANRVIADDLLLRGAGKASAARCRPLNNSGLPGATSRPQQTPANPDAPGPAMPADGGDAIVPWGWLVQRTREHDDLLAEVNTWHIWYPEQAELLRRKKLELPDPSFGQPPK